MNRYHEPLKKVSPGWETFVIDQCTFYRRWDLMLKRVNMKKYVLFITKN